MEILDLLNPRRRLDVVLLSDLLPREKLQKVDKSHAVIEIGLDSLNGEISLFKVAVQPRSERLSTASISQ